MQSRTDWLNHLGEGRLRVVEKIGWLQPAGVSATFPCSNHYYPGCFREIVEQENGYRAICTHHPRECDPVCLAADDLKQLAPNFEIIARGLRQHWNLGGSTSHAAQIPQVYPVGVWGYGVTSRTVFFSISRTHDLGRFSVMASELFAAKKIALLVPADDWIKPDEQVIFEKAGNSVVRIVGLVNVTTSGAVDCVTTPDVLFGDAIGSPNRIPGVVIEVLSGSEARVIRDGEVGEPIDTVAISSLRERQRVGQDWIVRFETSKVKSRLEKDQLKLPGLFLSVTDLEKTNPARAKGIREAVGKGQFYIVRAEIRGVGPQ